MRNGDDEGLDPRLEQRLHDELDQVQPRFSSPRYLSAHRRPVLLRLAPGVLVATVVAMLGLTVYAGSPNPVVWTEHVVNLGHATPSPSPQETPAQHTQNPQPSDKPEQHASPEPSEKPEPSESPEQHESPESSQSPESHESPEPSGEHSGDGSGGGSSSGTSDSGDVERS